MVLSTYTGELLRPPKRRHYSFQSRQSRHVRAEFAAEADTNCNIFGAVGCHRFGLCGRAVLVISFVHSDEHSIELDAENPQTGARSRASSRSR
jgi:hypothetical protein